MNAWQIRLEEILSATDAPPALNRTLLARFARNARGSVVPTSSLSHWVKQVRARSKLRPVVRGLFLNLFKTPGGTLADAAAWLHNDAVVSLNTVLGDAGVLNNPSHTITVVVPIEHRAPPPRLGRQTTRAGTLHVFGIPRRIFDAGNADERLEVHSAYPRATPEKALLDWLYLAASPRSHRTWPPHEDIDLELLSLKRLRNLAKAAHLETVLEKWLANAE